MGSRLDRIHDWEDRVRNAMYRTSTLASHAGVTRQQMERYFRIRWGVAPHLWIERVRIDDALRLLRQGKLIKEIACELGYRNATHFSRAFRRVAGRSPTSFVTETPIVRVLANGPNVPKWSERFQNGPSTSLMRKGASADGNALANVRSQPKCP